MFHKLEPEVAGHFGSGTVIDDSTHPPVVRSLHYVFNGWLGDEVITAFPCFIVTEHMRQLIESVHPTGCTFDAVKVTTSDQFDELYPGRQLPQFFRLMIDGIAHRDDFGTTATGGAIIVSQRVLQAMRRGQLDHCEVSDL